jgi:hypothetical protein
LEWHTLSSPDNLDELAKLFSGFARKPLERKLMLGILGMCQVLLDNNLHLGDLHLINLNFGVFT